MIETTALLDELKSKAYIHYAAKSFTSEIYGSWLGVGDAGACTAYSLAQADQGSTKSIRKWMPSFVNAQ